jgi:thioredoxin reductase (NADPH)
MNNFTAIIGCGPAGAACAIQMKRSGLDPVVYEENEIGGTIRLAHQVENYPGFPFGVSGSRLASLIQEACNRWQITVIPEKVLSLKRHGELLRVCTNGSAEDYSRVIVATGTRPKRLNGVSIDEGAREKVIYNILEVKDRRYEKVGILGGGEVAMDYAMHLSTSTEVHVFYRGKRPRSIPLLYDRAREYGILFHETGRLESVRAADDQLELVFESGSFNVNALLPSIGREPTLDFIAGDLLASREKMREQNKLLFIGDVINGPYRQVAIAAGDGLRLAMEMYVRWK